MRLRIRKDTNRKTRDFFNLEKLQDNAVKASYIVEVENRFQELAACEEEKPPNELWEAMKNSITDAASGILGRGKKEKNKPWITAETLDLIENRRSLKPRISQSDEGRKEYAKANAAVQRQTRKDKQNWLQERCAEVEQNLKANNPKTAFSVVRRLRKGFAPRQHNILDDSGRLLSDIEDIKKRWLQYTQQLYSDDSRDVDATTACKDEVRSTTTEITPVLVDKVREAIRRLPRGKASGFDELPAELTKVDSDIMAKMFCKLCNEILNREEWPDDWKRPVFVAIPKVKGTVCCDEHRTIALISHASKILLRVLLNRMQKTAEEELADVQTGFQKNVGTRDQIFNTRIMMQKAHEASVRLYMAFIDYKKAFDSVKHAKLWTILQDMGMSMTAINALRTLYRDQQAAVRIDAELTEWFPLGKGVKQGCLVSQNICPGMLQSGTR